MDYYELLSLNKNSTDLEIKQAFKKVAIRLNKNLKQNDAVEELFMRVAEAYDVLSDDQRRSVYDQYGEQELKKGLQTPEGFVKPYIYHGDYMRTYEEFFGTRNPYEDIFERGNLPIYNHPEGRGIKTKPSLLNRPLYCTLEEVYQGTLKKMKILRHEFISAEGNGQTELREKILDIQIKPGLPEGTTITFKNEGDEGPSMIPADISFTLKDRPHDVFIRDGLNLVMTVNVTLLEALVGTIVTVNTLDERIFRVPINDIISPQYTKIVPLEGMPDADDPTKKGDLVIKFNVRFPTYLPRARRNIIRNALNVGDMVAVPGDAENVSMSVHINNMNRLTHYDDSPTAG